MNAQHRRRREHRSAGFTLIELMISLAVGGIALGSIYAVGSASTRYLREQQRVSNTQTAVRAAMEQIKRDLQRAGFLASPNATLQGEACAAPASTVAAITEYTNDVAIPAGMVSEADETVFNSSGEVTFDDVVLMGNYATSGEYAVAASSTTALLAVARGWQSFRRDFSDWTDPSPTNFDATLFEHAFRKDRMFRLHTQDEHFFYGMINTSSGNGGTADPTITPSPQITNCAVVGGWVSPLSSIRYHVEPATAGDLAVDTTSATTTARTAARAVATGPIAVLRRTETRGDDHQAMLMDEDDNTIPVDDRSVLDYVVSFNLSFRGTGGVPNGVAWPPVAESVVNGSPQQLRTAIIDVAARTAEQETTMAITNNAPLRSFIVFDQATRPGAARVRSERAEILLPNIALRKL